MTEWPVLPRATASREARITGHDTFSGSWMMQWLSQKWPQSRWVPIVRRTMVVQPLLTGTIISPRRSEGQSSTTDYDRQNQEHGRKDGGGLRRNRTVPALGLSNPTGDLSVVTDANSPTNTQPDFIPRASLSTTMSLTRKTDSQPNIMMGQRPETKPRPRLRQLRRKLSEHTWTDY